MLRLRLVGVSASAAVPSPLLPARRALSILSKTTSPGTVIVETDGTRRELLYSGPVNGLMTSTMRTLAAISAGNAVVGPVLWHYCASQARPFTTTLFFTSYVWAMSGAFFWGMGRQYRRYILHAYRLLPKDGKPTEGPIEDELIEIDTFDWKGTRERRAWFIRDLHVSAPGEISARSTGERFHFCPQRWEASSVLAHLSKK